ncbi:MAG: hypothetical protein WD810_00030 [Solirubrobacterales bacterium]
MSKVFSLEALRAEFGDSLLLRYGHAADPRLVLIDGGPSGVYKDALAPRLAELVDARGGSLPIELVVVSHVDKDHVRGILDLSEALLEDEDLEQQLEVKGLWHNAFDDLLGPAVSTELETSDGTQPAEVEAVIAGVAEGEGLRDNADRLNWTLNPDFDEFVMAPEEGGATVDLGPLRITVVGPRQAEIEKLRVEWAKEQAKLKKAKGPAAAEIASNIDNSVTNLSSIVCLAECGGKRMLLTGDARGDKILAGLEAAGILEPKDSIELDLLKLPHHGSCRNLDQKFFERLRARHLVISADGEYDNPDVETLEMLSKARDDDEFTIHLTYSDFKRDVGPKVHGFFDAEKKAGRKYEVVFRPTDDLSMRIDLLDPPA